MQRFVDRDWGSLKSKKGLCSVIEALVIEECQVKLVIWGKETYAWGIKWTMSKSVSMQFILIYEFPEYSGGSRPRKSFATSRSRRRKEGSLVKH